MKTLDQYGCYGIAVFLRKKKCGSTLSNNHFLLVTCNYIGFFDWFFLKLAYFHLIFMDDDTVQVYTIR